MKRGLVGRIKRMERVVLPPMQTPFEAFERLLERTVGWDPHAWDLLHASFDVLETNPDALEAPDSPWIALLNRMADCAEAQDKRKLARV